MWHWLLCVAPSPTAPHGSYGASGPARRWDELLMSSVSMLCLVVMQAYILGTLFHYLAKRDPKLEAFRCAPHGPSFRRTDLRVAVVLHRFCR